MQFSVSLAGDYPDLPEGLSPEDSKEWIFDRFVKDHNRSVYGVDENLGRVLDFLDESGQAEDTLVVYTTDNGFFLGEHGWYDKRWMYEESLKMPFIAKWPGVTKPGSRNDLMIQNLDYAETFLDIAGLDIPNDMQGKSLVPLLKGQRPEDWRKSIYYHYYEYPSVHMVPRHYGIRTETEKLIHFYQFDEWEYYNLNDDPDELLNQYNNPKNQTRIAELKEQLKDLQDHYEDDSDMAVKPKEWQRSMRH